MKITTTLILTGILFLMILAGCVQNPTPPNGNPNGNNPKACSQEAKICPDGSAVVRVGPNCEFAPCPETNTNNPPRTTPPGTTTTPPSTQPTVALADPCTDVIAQASSPEVGAKIASNCYNSAAQSRMDATLCDKIPSEKTQNIQTCKSVVAARLITAQALQQGNLALCNQIVASAEDPYTLPLYRTQCQHQVAVKTKNVQGCDQMDAVAYTKDVCYNDVAVAKLDLSICDSPTTDFWKKGCAINVNNAIRVGSCDNITFGKDTCWQSKAIIENDATICAKIDNSSAMDFEITKQREAFDTQTGTNVVGSQTTQSFHGTARDNCYFTMALQLLDRKYCDSITTPALQNACTNFDGYEAVAMGSTSV